MFETAFNRYVDIDTRRRLRMYAHALKSLGPWPAIRALFRRYDLKSTIVISGCPRSGTTWVAEVLSSLPAASILYEPLYLRAEPILQELGLRWRTYIAPEEDRPEIESYMRDVLSGRVLNPWTLSRADKNKVAGTQIWVVKFVRANLLLEWLVPQFPIMPPLVIIRHPCAVVSSQLRMGSWNHVAAPVECPEFFSRYPQFAPVRDRLKYLDEFLALAWCLDYYTIIKIPLPSPWLLVPYEELVKEPRLNFY